MRQTNHGIRVALLARCLEILPKIAERCLAEMFQQFHQQRRLMHVRQAHRSIDTSQAEILFGGGPVGAWRLDGEPYIAVEPVLAQGRKCARSWRILPEVGSDPRYPDLSLRDADAVAQWDRAHA